MLKVLVLDNAETLEYYNILSTLLPESQIELVTSTSIACARVQKSSYDLFVVSDIRDKINILDLCFGIKHSSYNRFATTIVVSDNPTALARCGDTLR
ncbi:hypothetical protein LCGC14_2508200, partial [marine sediment metagenome]